MRSTKQGHILISNYEGTIFATHADTIAASRNLQEHLNTVENWLKKKENKGKRNQVIARNIYP